MKALTLSILNKLRRRSPGLGVLCACMMLVAAELALQVRAEVRSGQSIFSRVQGETKYVYDEELQLRTLRPLAVIGGAEQEIRTNRYGLRGDDFEMSAPPGEVRLALLGASTIQGAFARTNDETSSAVLERRLRGSDSELSFRVVNAGLDGTTLGEQARLLERLLPRLDVKYVVWYPGTNSISCRSEHAAATTTRPSPVRMPWISLPRWTLTNDLIVLNTAQLRKSNVPSNQNLVPSFDLDEMRQAIERGIEVAKANGISVALVTSANSYRADMPPEEITRRASTALFFRPCYTGPTLAAAVEEFNAMVREVAALRGVPLIDAAKRMPTDIGLFGDSNHFSPKGEEEFAKLLADELAKLGWIPET